MATFEMGRIVWAVIPDKNGVAKPDPRPAMVMKTVTVTNPDDLIQVIAGSTDVRDPPPDDQVVIHNSYQLDRATKLRRPTALICSWISSVKFGDIQSTGGFIRGGRSFPIVQKALELNRSPELPSSNEEG